MPRTQLIGFRRFARTHQIPQRLVRSIRDPYGSEISGAVAARQPIGITPLRLAPSPRLYRTKSGAPTLALHPKLRGLPVQCVAGRPRFVADPQPLGLSK